MKNMKQQKIKYTCKIFIKHQKSQDLNTIYEDVLFSFVVLLCV